MQRREDGAMGQPWDIPGRVRETRHALRATLRRARATLDEIQRQADAARRGARATFRDLGIDVDFHQGPIIDVGRTPSLLRRALHAGVAGIAAVLLVAMTFGLGLLLGQMLLHFLLMTRGLGLSVDVGTGAAS